MARKLPKLRAELMAEIEAAWVQPQDAWARRRLVVRLIAQHELTVAVAKTPAAVVGGADREGGADTPPASNLFL